MVGGETTVGPEVQPSCGVHLHQEGLVLLLSVLGFRHLDEHEVGGGPVHQHREARHGVAPGDVVVVGVEQPAPVPAARPEDDEAEEKQQRGDDLHAEGEEDQVVLEPEDVLHRPAQQEAGVDDLGGETDDEGDSRSELTEDEPPGHQPLSDQPVFVAPDHGTAREDAVELELGVTEVLKAELPEAHVAEG